MFQLSTSFFSSRTQNIFSSSVSRCHRFSISFEQGIYFACACHTYLYYYPTQPLFNINFVSVLSVFWSYGFLRINNLIRVICFGSIHKPPRDFLLTSAFLNLHLTKKATNLLEYILLSTYSHHRRLKAG